MGRTTDPERCKWDTTGNYHSFYFHKLPQLSGKQSLMFMQVVKAQRKLKEEYLMIILR